MWANEQEAAVLSGVGVETFRDKVKKWEARGFPRVNPENGKRAIPLILAFWRLPANHFEIVETQGHQPGADDEDGREKWDA